jgi:two-component system KDP operon response regulator KdpE
MKTQSGVLAIPNLKPPTAKARILVVDNDVQIRRLMRTTLTAQGFEVNEAASGDEAIDRLRAAKFDLVILDVNMPGMNGIDTCREIRAGSDVSVIMLTVRTTEKDKTDAFDAGADDYVTKPFSMPELLARVRASLRRRALPLEFERRRLRLGDIEIDFEAREIRGRKQQEKLTPKEFDLLSYLAAHANRVVTHHELLKEVWGSDTGGEKEYLRVFINRLRKKIEKAPDDPKYLLTEHWLGYRLRLPD